MTEVKICGITCEKEIQFLNILKPHYIGFVFAESKRKIDAEKAASLLSILDKDIKAVGVFRNNTIDEIVSVLNKTDLYGVQLHGNEDFEFIEKLKSQINNKVKIWKALSIKDEEAIYKFMSRKHEDIDMYLIDGDNPGSGEDYNLNSLKSIIEKFNLNNKYILAGGITKDNVIHKIKEVSPKIVDVSSGVEIMENHRRIKDFEKMKELLNEVRL